MTRRELHVELDLPTKDAYGAFLSELIASIEDEDG